MEPAAASFESELRGVIGARNERTIRSKTGSSIPYLPSLLTAIETKPRGAARSREGSRSRETSRLSNPRFRTRSAACDFEGDSVHVGLERSGESLVEEEAAGEGGHERAGDPGVGAVAEGHPEAGALPLHAPVEDAVGAADDLVGLEEEARADGVGEGRDERRAAPEAGQGVLLDGQRVQPGAEPVGLGFPRRRRRRTRRRNAAPRRRYGRRGRCRRSRPARLPAPSARRSAPRSGAGGPAWRTSVAIRGRSALPSGP